MDGIKKLINIVLITIITICLIAIGFNNYLYDKSIDIYTDIQEQKENKVVNDSDYLWIQIDNTKINYPVLQAENNDFYLKHDYTRNYNIAGAIFMDYRNNFETDNNTIIYGHNMANGTMFGELKHYNNQEYANNNKDIKISIGDTIYTYRVFSSYITKANDNYRQIEFSTVSDYNNYIERIASQSLIKNDVDLTAINKTITLSTCSINNAERQVVHAYLYDLQN